MYVNYFSTESSPLLLSKKKIDHTRQAAVRVDHYVIGIGPDAGIDGFM